MPFIFTFSWKDAARVNERGHSESLNILKEIYDVQMKE